MEQLSNAKRKARKPHKCMWCGCKIEKGTIYAVQCCKEDGELYTWKNHTECAELANINNWFDDYEGLGDLEFKDYLSDLSSENGVNILLSNFEQIKACLELK